ncbi:MAG: NAD-dependent epimerase/dehydratase family protein [Planctomycetota bacterium]|nr:NAD-dependent epimerase/dehydratase family protein [Planctomycetota bacterium]
MKRYLITGGAGFIGSHLATGLIERGDSVRVLDSYATGNRDNLAHLEVGEAGSGAPVELIEGDIRDFDTVLAAAEGIEGIFHEAAQVSVPRSIELPMESYAVNVTGSLNVVEAAHRAGVRKVVAAASSAAYGDSDELPKHEAMLPNPLSPYASGKLSMEQTLAVWGKVHGMHTVNLRYFNVFGPRQADDSPYTGVIAIFARALILGKPVTIFGDGGQTRDFTYIDNVVAANLAAMDAGDEPGRVAPGQVFNVGVGERISLNQLYDAMAELAGVSERPSYEAARAGDVRHSLASLERVRAGLGYEPRIGFAEGIERTFRWYQERLA